MVSPNTYDKELANWSSPLASIGSASSTPQGIPPNTPAVGVNIAKDDDSDSCGESSDSEESFNSQQAFPTDEDVPSEPSFESEESEMTSSDEESIAGSENGDVDDIEREERDLLESVEEPIPATSSEEEALRRGETKVLELHRLLLSLDGRSKKDRASIKVMREKIRKARTRSKKAQEAAKRLNRMSKWAKEKARLLSIQAKTLHRRNNHQRHKAREIRDIVNEHSHALAEIRKKMERKSPAERSNSNPPDPEPGFLIGRKSAPSLVHRKKFIHPPVNTKSRPRFKLAKRVATPISSEGVESTEPLDENLAQTPTCGQKRKRASLGFEEGQGDDEGEDEDDGDDESRPRRRRAKIKGKERLSQLSQAIKQGASEPPIAKASGKVKPSLIITLKVKSWAKKTSEGTSSQVTEATFANQPAPSPKAPSKEPEIKTEGVTTRSKSEARKTASPDSVNSAIIVALSDEERPRTQRAAKRARRATPKKKGQKRGEHDELWCQR